MIRKGIRPDFRLGMDLPGSGGYRRVLPFRRSWKLIFFLVLLDGLLLAPAWAAFHQAAEQWSNFDDLFNLVVAVFLSAWFLGWSVAPLLLTAVLVVVLLGREVIRATEHQLELFIGLPFIGLVSRYEVRSMRNLQRQPAPQKSGRSWRGNHLAFDYGANRVELGSDLSVSDVNEIKLDIESACGLSIREGTATEDELGPAWAIGEPLKTRMATTGNSHSPLRSVQTIGWSSPSTLLLILANLVPVTGAAFFDWSLGEVMVLYWCESAIIGIYNLARIVAISRWAALITGTFFMAHYSAFMAVHFLFIYAFFVEGPGAGGSVSGGDLSQVGRMFMTLWPALLALFLSHGYSFVVNFLGRFEFESRSVNEQMTEPYRRIVVMHLVLIFGGGLTLVLGSATPVLLLVIALKIWVDVRAHIKEHAGQDR